MRFGISATSWIFPKNLRTRLRPVNVCAIVYFSRFVRTASAGTPLRKAAIHRDHPDRRRDRSFLCDLGLDAESLRTAANTVIATGAAKSPFRVGGLCRDLAPRPCHRPRILSPSSWQIRASDATDFAANLPATSARKPVDARNLHGRASREAVFNSISKSSSTCGSCAAGAAALPIAARTPDQRFAFPGISLK